MLYGEINRWFFAQLTVVLAVFEKMLVGVGVGRKEHTAVMTPRLHMKTYSIFI
jgi:hypothetical protein